MHCRTLFMLGAFLFSSAASANASEATYPTDPTSVAKGLELAQTHCAACHAVGSEGLSAKAEAPAFRELSSLYPLESLEESLAEGIVTAHESMPEIAFEPEEIDAFLGYLTSIQSN